MAAKLTLPYEPFPTEFHKFPDISFRDEGFLDFIWVCFHTGWHAAFALVLRSFCVRRGRIALMSLGLIGSRCMSRLLYFSQGSFGAKCICGWRIYIVQERPLLEDDLVRNISRHLV